jgi:hypothetical protein
LHSVFKALAERKADNAIQGFVVFSVWIGQESKPCTVGVSLCNALLFLLLVEGQGENTGKIIESVTTILNHGMTGFATDCELYQDAKSGSDCGVIAFWPEIGTMKVSKCSPSGLRMMSEMHDVMSRNEAIKELLITDGKLRTGGIRIMNMEAFIEVEEGRSQPVPDLYGKLKQFVPNLPEEIQGL